MEDIRIQSLKVIVLGASTKPSRYSNKAIRALNKAGHKVFAIGRSVNQSVDGIRIESSLDDLDSKESIHTISMYLNEANQTEYEDAIIALKPKRVIFNPGAENMDLFKRLKENNIEAINACTLVMLSIGNF